MRNLCQISIYDSSAANNNCRRAVNTARRQAVYERPSLAPRPSPAPRACSMFTLLIKIINRTEVGSGTLPTAKAWVIQAHLATCTRQCWLSKPTFVRISRGVSTWPLFTSAWSARLSTFSESFPIPISSENV